MTDIYINNTGDLKISNTGDIQLVTDENELMQQLYIAINEDIKHAPITVYDTNLSMFEGEIIDDNIIEYIKTKITNAVKTISRNFKTDITHFISNNNNNLYLNILIQDISKNNKQYKILIRITSDNVYITNQT